MTLSPVKPVSEEFCTSTERRKKMKKTASIVAAFVLMSLGAASAQGGQFPMADMVAQNLVMKYQNSTCEQLWQERMQKQGQPKSPREQEAIQMLRSNPAMRTEFLNIIAAPIVNKMFECGMIP
jgi:phage-related protein